MQPSSACSYNLQMTQESRDRTVPPSSLIQLIKPALNPHEKKPSQEKKPKQLFARQKYINRHLGEEPLPDPPVYKPFKPYDLTRSPPRVHRPRVLQKCELPLKDIISEMAIDLKKTVQENNYLPLDPFCSDSGDTISTEEYLRQIKEQKQISAHILNLDTSTYDQANLIDESLKEELSGTIRRREPQAKSNFFWLKTEKGFQKAYRWQLAFPNQNRRQLVNKIVQGCKLRNQMDSLLRYNYYVQNMPQEDIEDLQNSIQLKIIQKVGIPFQKTDIDPLLAEVNSNFLKLQNKILFDKYLLSNDSNKLFSRPLELQKAPHKEVPEFGRLQLEAKKGASDFSIMLDKLIRTQSKSFDQIFTQFGLSSLQSVKEVPIALRKIKEECLKLQTVEFFNTNFVQGYTTLQDFKHAQEHYIHRGLRKLIDTFPQSINEIIRAELKVDGQNKSQVLDQERFRRFIELAQHHMKDALFETIKRNYYNFSNLLASYTPSAIDIVSAGKVVNTYSDSDDDVNSVYYVKKRTFPLFRTMLKINSTEDDFTFTLSPKQFVTLFHTYFKKTLSNLQNISDLESKYIPQYDNFQIVKGKMKVPYLPSQRPKTLQIRSGVIIQDQNLWLFELFQKFDKNLETVTQPLFTYQMKYTQYKQFLAMKIEPYLQKIQADEAKQVKEIRQQILENRRKQKEIPGQIIEKIQVGLFEVETKQISDYMANKYKKIAQGLTKVIANRVISQTNAILAQFQEINKKIEVETTNIEQASELKDYMQGQAVIEIAKLKTEIEKNIELYNILDEQQFKLEPSVLEARWRVFKQPRDTTYRIHDRLQVFQKERDRYQREMYQEQANYQKEFDALERYISAFHQNSNINSHETTVTLCNEVMGKLGNFTDLTRRFNSRQQLLGKDTTDYGRLGNAAKQFGPYNTLWTITSKWYGGIDQWMTQPFADLDADFVEKFVQESVRSAAGVMRIFKDKGLQQIVAVAEKVKSQMDKFKPNLPLMVSLRKQGMKQRHWKAISDSVGFEVDPNVEGFNFQMCLQMGLLKSVQTCVDVGEKASKEFNIQTMLKDMWKIWEDINFDLAPYKTSNIIRGYDQIQMILDQHLVNTQSIQFSAFKKPFQEQILTWYSQLKTVSDVMQEWMKCQGQWMYLQPIFDSADIAKQLPLESKKFKGVDITWKNHITLAKTLSNVLRVCCTQGILEKIKESNMKLEQIQKELNNYLEKKRERFARFYFLSNDDLLEILSQTKEPTAVQPHLKKVFENIHSIQFDSKKHINAMFSAEKEKIAFKEIVNPNGKNVEDWMGEVEDMMRQSVRQELLVSVEKYKSTKRTDWVCNHPGQCVLNGSQILWTQEVEVAIKSLTVEPYFQKLTAQLNDLVELVRQPLSKQQQVTLNALIVIDVHAKDVVQKLVASSVTDVGSFEWISQLRYYWQNNDCFVKCVQTNFPYGYEYLGNTLRLVITPLTDKCYMTLMGALKLNLGGAPAGPAGTGKTESTKDLAKALAKQCVVFNCSDSMDYIMIGKFFKGLASAGAWCCFDQFNRINIQVLSVIAQQLLILFGQKAKGSQTCEFEGSTIKILPTFSVFITMNPGYAGRTELPDNLKALFRAVAMMVPDYAMIGEIMLYSFGFKKGRDLAKKMVATFKLSSEQLSSQDHYDYGMRAVRSVINAAGLLKSATPDMNEDQLLLRALRDVNVPKFLEQDLPLFQNIITDLFPGTQRPKIEYGQLLDSINNTCSKLNLQPVKNFIDKVIQLYDTIQVRHGLMVVGPTGGAKTSNFRVLTGAMTALEKKGQAKVHMHILNPKSITMGQLYGQFNDQTHEWADGILAYMVRQCVKDQSTEKHWIVFDGPVDSLWIQSMNTVLDDNKKLCLNSGQILTLTPQMTMMFEVEDLAVASPATVSRCGMVYMEPSSIGTKPLIDSWLNLLPTSFKERKNLMASLQHLFSTYVDTTLYFLRSNCKEPVTTSDGNVVQSLMRIIYSFIEPYKDTQVKKTPPEQLEILEQCIQSYFIWGLVWSFGCTTDLEGRKKMNSFLRDLMMQNKVDIPIPEAGTVYDYEFKDKQKEWVEWTKSFQNFQIDSRLSYHEIAIPTSDSTRNLYLTKLLLTHNYHVLTLGPTGTGKSLNAYKLLITGLPQIFQYISITFSAQTSANQTQDTIDAKMDKRRKGIYGPPLLKKCVIFVDDLNMPKKETYGAQPPIQLIRQYLDHKGWYNRKDLQFMNLEDLLILGAMGPPGGGRTYITNRLVRHFNVLAYTELPKQIILQIFGSLLNYYFRKFPEKVRGMGDLVAESCLDVFQLCKGNLLPTPSKSHYTFNLRDIWRVVQGICSASPKEINQPIHLVKLWYHQNMRVYHDRLINEEDKSLFISGAVEIANKDFKEELARQEHNQDRVFVHQRLIYGDFMAGRDGDNRNYCEIHNMDRFMDKMNQLLDQYNAEMGSKKAMKLVMFLEACEHICRIARIIKQPQGNALLLGVGGSGRQSLARLASFISGYKTEQIQVIKNYSMRNWRDDIKGILLKAGVQNKPLSFLFVDTQIINEQMLQDINGILNSGDVTNLYQEKDFEDITTSCKAECLKKNLQPNKMNIFTVYLNRVKRNIHIIICMSPLGEAFATRLRMFPSLVNSSTIDWFSEWPDEALVGVGKGQLLDVQIDLGLQGKLDTLVESFKCVHKSVERQSIKFKAQLSRNNYVTPTSYLELLSMYKTILKQKLQESKFSISRLQNGLDKLSDANLAVEDMQIMLTKKQPQLEQASEETQKLMVKLTIDKAEAEEVQKVVSVEKKEADIQKLEASQLAAEAEAGVAQANATLQATLAEVKKLKKDHLNEIRSLTNPPVAIKVTLAGVVILLQDAIKKAGGQIIIKNVDGKKEEDYFETAKKFLLNDVGLLMTLLTEYKKESISAAFIKKLQEKCLPDPDFTLERAKTCSYAIQFLYLWVKAMYDFNNVYNSTKPLRQKLEATQKLLSDKTAFLKEKMDALNAVNKKIEDLEKLFSQKILLKETLIKDIEMCRVKLTRAKKLTEGLSDEQKRWSLDVKRLKENAHNISGNSVVAAGMVAYAGPFTADYRTRLEKCWIQKLQELNIPYTQNVNMRSFLGIPVKIQSWNILGLPKDDTSTENGIIIDKARRWPLMIDPQTQANKFLKSLGKQHQEGLEIVKATDSNLMKKLETAIQLGSWVLMEGVGKDLDPSLQPILLQKIVKTGSSLSITIGQKTFMYNTSFKFFMTTTVPNPHYPPETFVKVSIINFAITPSGLEEQMLAQIVALENPQLQQKKLDIVLKNSQDKKTLISIQDSILKALSSTQGNIDEFLKDESLINELQNSKKMSSQINLRVDESKITEKQIDQTREGYRPVAYRSSLLFFCILDLALIDPMYQYSLQWFTRLFVMGVENSERSENLQERLGNMNNYFTYSLYENVCRSLFEKQKLLFSFLLTIKILQGQNKIDKDEWRYLLAGPTGEIDIPPNPTTWISANQWPDLYRQFFGMGLLPVFKGIQDHLVERQIEWKRIFDSPHPNKQRLPSPYDTSLTQFQKIIVVKSIRADKVIPAIQAYVSNTMGERFIIAPTFDLAKCYKDATLVTPLIFVLSAGSDPVADFIKFAEEMGMGSRYESISLGQGQGKKAEKLIRDATVKGGWILLQNCHLAVSWMNDLERVCEQLHDGMHADFRLWLTSMPTPSFSIAILQNSVKMTLEPPQGLRNNLLRTYTNLDLRQFQDCSKPGPFKKLLFGFCLFHAIVQDRRKFGPIGWNIPYEFTNQDLMVCRRQLKMLLDQYDEIPFKVLNYLGSQINYGGRVTDDKDVRLITTILKGYINPESLQEGYNFSVSGVYIQPSADRIQQYIRYIQGLPLNPSPEAFGLNDNAEITNAQNQTYQMLESILTIQPKSSSSGGKPRDQTVIQLADFVQNRTPDVFPILEIQKKYPTSYQESMNTVLVQQIIRYNRLLAVMKENLVNVKKAVKGLIVMSEELQLISNSIFDNQVPKLWDQKGFLSMKPLASWTQDLNNRVTFLQDWIDNGTPAVFWISGFFFPQAFLTGTLQNYARRHYIAIDKLSFQFNYLDHITHKDIKQKPADGCYIHGMFIEGACWDKTKHIINDPLPKELYSNLPLIHLVPKADRVPPKEGIYNCPVYKVVSRRGTLSTTGHSTNFVMFFELPTNKSEEYWIKAGVAAFLSLRY